MLLAHLATSDLFMPDLSPVFYNQLIVLHAAGAHNVSTD